MVAGRRTEAIDIPGGLHVELDGHYVTVRRPTKEKTLIPPDPVDIRLDDLPITFDFGPFRLFFSLCDPSEERTQTRVGPSHDTVSIAAPVEIRAVRIRAPEPGDKMAPLGMDGHTKKLSDIFIDKKVPQRERYVQPIVVDASNGNILAIPALALISEESRISSNSVRRLDIVVCRVTG
jgi:tRNA(Ile)-lysidine synthetase-like protein